MYGTCSGLGFLLPFREARTENCLCVSHLQPPHDTLGITHHAVDVACDRAPYLIRYPYTS